MPDGSPRELACWRIASAPDRSRIDASATVQAERPTGQSLGTARGWPSGCDRETCFSTTTVVTVTGAATVVAGDGAEPPLVASTAINAPATESIAATTAEITRIRRVRAPDAGCGLPQATQYVLAGGLTAPQAGHCRPVAWSVTTRIVNGPTYPMGTVVEKTLGSSVMRLRIVVGLVMSLLLVGTAVAGARTLVITTDHRSCVDCSLPEASKPARFRTDAGFSQRMGAFSIRFSQLHFKQWGAATTRARGRAQIGYLSDPLRSAHARLSLTRLRPHAPDGCGHLGTDKIYTRAVITISSPAAFAGRFTVKLPRTGCETA